MESDDDTDSDLDYVHIDDDLETDDNDISTIVRFKTMDSFWLTFDERSLWFILHLSKYSCVVIAVNCNPTPFLGEQLVLYRPHIVSSPLDTCAYGKLLHRANQIVPNITPAYFLINLCIGY